MSELLRDELKEYSLPNGWKISFPKEWEHEYEPYPEGDQYLFFPSNDDLTFRITSYGVENESGYAPIEVLGEIFRNTCEKSMKKKVFDFACKDFEIECFEGTTMEGWKRIRKVSVGVMVEGFLLIVNMFASNRNSIEQSLRYINTICRE